MTIQMEDIHRTKYVGRAVELPCSHWAHYSLSYPEALWTLYLGIFMEASSHRRDWSLTQFLVLCLFLNCRGLGWKLWVSNHGLVFLVTSHQSKKPTKHFLISTKDAFITQETVGFSNCVKNKVKDWTTEQKILLVLLLLRRLLGFRKTLKELCARN